LGAYVLSWLIEIVTVIDDPTYTRTPSQTAHRSWR